MIPPTVPPMAKPMGPNIIPKEKQAMKAMIPPMNDCLIGVPSLRRRRE